MEKEIKITYIGGGSKMWAPIFMGDLTLQKGLYGEIALYDIDIIAANNNKLLGHKYNSSSKAETKWIYKVYETLEEALIHADVVIISILPGTFSEMACDVNYPMEYGIYQSVGDTVGPGGILRAMRTVPIYENFALKIKKICPEAWVVNLTNPMSICVKTLYDVFPEIKAFGCCHEVFNAQEFLTGVIEKTLNIERPNRRELKCDIAGINHFTWMSEAYYHDINVFDLLPSFIDKYFECGYYEKGDKDNWKENPFAYGNKVKMYWFNKYHVLASAGDRHLVEFVNNEWFLKDKKTIDSWHFALTSIELRIKKQEERTKNLLEIISNEKKLTLVKSNEEALDLIKAIFGFGDITSNVNIINKGQVDFLPLGCVVESNCIFSDNKLIPLKAKPLPNEVEDLIKVNAINTLNLYEAIKERSLDKIFEVFINEPLCQNISRKDAYELFNRMVKGTRKYLDEYYQID